MPDKAPEELIAKIPQDVRDLFEQLTLKLIRDGWAKYSADAILHRIRWHMRVERNVRNFKCNDHWTSHLSRWFADRYPMYAGFFDYRRLGRNHEDYEFFNE